MNAGKETVESNFDCSEVSGHSIDDEDHTDLEQAALPAPERAPALASTETKAVSTLRRLLLAFLVLTAAAVCICVHRYVQESELSIFEEVIEANTLKILEAFHRAVEVKLGAINSLSVHITTVALATNQTFPTVTIPDFAVAGANARILADSVDVWFCPLVTTETRADWEAYSIENRNQLWTGFAQDTSLKAQEDARYNYTVPDQTPPEPEGQEEQEAQEDDMEGQDNDSNRLLQERQGGPLEDGMFPYIQIFGAPRPYDEANQIYAPAWQLSPAMPAMGVLNFDLLQNPVGAGAFRETLLQGQAVIGAAADLELHEEGENQMDFFDMVLASGQYRHEAAKYAGDPISTISYPVFDSLGDQGERNVAGMLLMTIYWGFYFAETLPEDARGMHVVLEVSASRINSSRVNFISKRYMMTHPNVYAFYRTR